MIRRDVADHLTDQSTRVTNWPWLADITDTALDRPAGGHHMRHGRTAAAVTAVMALTGCTPQDPAVHTFTAAAPASTVTASPVKVDPLTVGDYPRQVDGGVRHVGIVRSVYDGDTMTVAIRDRTRPNTVTETEEKLRLAHIDAPEVRAKDTAEKEAGLRARDRLLELTPVGSVVTVIDLGPEKYGRTLAQVGSGPVDNVAEVLIREGFARPYEGGTR